MIGDPALGAKSHVDYCPAAGKYMKGLLKYMVVTTLATRRQTRGLVEAENFTSELSTQIYDIGDRWSTTERIAWLSVKPPPSRPHTCDLEEVVNVVLLWFRLFLTIDRTVIVGIVRSRAGSVCEWNILYDDNGRRLARDKRRPGAACVSGISSMTTTVGAWRGQAPAWSVCLPLRSLAGSVCEWNILYDDNGRRLARDKRRPGAACVSGISSMTTTVGAWRGQAPAWSVCLPLRSLAGSVCEWNILYDDNGRRLARASAGLDVCEWNILYDDNGRRLARASAGLECVFTAAAAARAAHDYMVRYGRKEGADMAVVRLSCQGEPGNSDGNGPRLLRRSRRVSTPSRAHDDMVRYGRTGRADMAVVRLSCQGEPGKATVMVQDCHVVPRVSTPSRAHDDMVRYGRTGRADMTVLRLSCQGEPGKATRVSTQAEHMTTWSDTVEQEERHAVCDCCQGELGNSDGNGPRLSLRVSTSSRAHDDMVRYGRTGRADMAVVRLSCQGEPGNSDGNGPRLSRRSRRVSTPSRAHDMVRYGRTGRADMTVLRLSCQGEPGNSDGNGPRLSRRSRRVSTPSRAHDEMVRYGRTGRADMTVVRLSCQGEPGNSDGNGCD
ncbi:hypothetical protein J6590_002122 [Homalodisca vitripennis]|nr:hypothetical protein J6590_002122 [Homalodisca vitripennis]